MPFCSLCTASAGHRTLSWEAISPFQTSLCIRFSGGDFSPVFYVHGSHQAGQGRMSPSLPKMFAWLVALRDGWHCHCAMPHPHHPRLHGHCQWKAGEIIRRGFEWLHQLLSLSLCVGDVGTVIWVAMLGLSVWVVASGEARRLVPRHPSRKATKGRWITSLSCFCESSEEVTLLVADRAFLQTNESIAKHQADEKHHVCTWNSLLDSRQESSANVANIQFWWNSVGSVNNW